VGFLFRFKVAVVQPDLPELLANTPTDIFTTVWVRWREIPLYYIHYTDLLRLVALYK
jgi:lactosylceramide 4-alpha-galactosyltransferase